MAGEAEIANSRERKKPPAENEQVYICLDGIDGVVIQTTRATFESYYRPLGYRLLGIAMPKLPPPEAR